MDLYKTKEDDRRARRADARRRAKVKDSEQEEEEDDEEDDEDDEGDEEDEEEDYKTDICYRPIFFGRLPVPGEESLRLDSQTKRQVGLSRRRANDIARQEIDADMVAISSAIKRVRRDKEILNRALAASLATGGAGGGHRGGRDGGNFGETRCRSNYGDTSERTTGTKRKYGTMAENTTESKTQEDDGERDDGGDDDEEVSRVVVQPEGHVLDSSSDSDSDSIQEGWPYPNSDHANSNDHNQRSRSDAKMVDGEGGHRHSRDDNIPDDKSTSSQESDRTNSPINHFPQRLGSESDLIQVDDSDNEDDSSDSVDHSSDKEDESVSGPESHYGSTHSTRSRSHELIHSSTTSMKSGDEVEEGYASSESNETLQRFARSTHRRRSLPVIVSSDSEDESDSSAQPLKGLARNRRRSLPVIASSDSEDESDTSAQPLKSAARNRTRMIITSSSTSSDASEDDDASGKESEPDSETRGRRARGGGRIPAQTTTRPSNPVGYHSSSEDEDEDDVEGKDESEDEEEEEEYEPQEPASSSPGYQAPNPEQNDMADKNALISLMDYGTAAIDRPHRGGRLPAPPIPTSSSEDGDRERYEEGDADELNTDNEGPSSDRGNDSDHSDYYGS